MDSLATIILCAYLLLTISRSGGLYGLLKLVLLIHVAGDYLFNGYWETANTEYEYLRQVTEEMRFRGNLLLLLALMVSDATFFGAEKVVSRSRGLIGFGGRKGFSTSREFGALLLGVAFLIKLYIGVNVGFFYVVPGDTVGYYGLYSIANILIPIGAGALFGLSYIPATMVFLIAAIFSYSKAQALIFFATYVVYCAYGYGIRAVIKQLFSIKMLIVLVAIIASIGVKTATRGGTSGDAIDQSVVIENVAAAVDSRFMGGIHRAYLTVADEIVSARMDAMRGTYHLQTFYLWIPRAFWPDKPVIASSDLKDYLHVEGEDNGTSYAINAYGFLLADFGLQGILVGAALLGIIIRLIEECLTLVVSAGNSGNEKTTLSAALVTAWVMAAQQLSEGGIPPAVMTLLTSLTSCIAGYYLYQFLKLMFCRKWRAVNVLRTSTHFSAKTRVNQD